MFKVYEIRYYTTRLDSNNEPHDTDQTTARVLAADAQTALASLIAYLNLPAGTTLQGVSINTDEQCVIYQP